MTILVVGDSVANGIGNALLEQGTDVRWFAKNGEQAGEPMRSHFENALSAMRTLKAQHPDERFDVFVSAGYNGGNLEELRPMLKALIDEGANVVISGLKERWAEKGGSYEQHLAGETPARNTALRNLAGETGATFAEATLPIANAIRGDEIHGNFAELAAALEATAERARHTSATTTASPYAPRTALDLATEQPVESVLQAATPRPLAAYGR